jgi:D-alanyl-D-alanine dipeptidase
MAEEAAGQPASGRRQGLRTTALAHLRTAAAALAGLAALALPTAQAQDGDAAPALPEPLVYLRDVDPSVLQDIRYAGPDNFTGRPVPGYVAGECVLMREAADALARVQQALLARRLSLKVYDCYRPRQAVRAFVAWVKDGNGTPADTFLKRFHPNIERSRIITDGYVAAVSQHSRGDTVDLTLVELPMRPTAPFSRQTVYGPCTGPAEARAPDAGVDMGTGYDCFDPLSHTASAGITQTQAGWRRTLLEAMSKEGFRNYRREWWHFTLASARPARAFSAPIVPRRP